MQKTDYIALATKNYKKIIEKELNKGPIFTFIEKINNTLAKGILKVFYYGLFMIPLIIDCLLGIKNSSSSKVNKKLEILKKEDDTCKLVFLRAQNLNGLKELIRIDKEIIAQKAALTVLREQNQKKSETTKTFKITQEILLIRKLIKENESKQIQAENDHRKINNEYEEFTRKQFPNQSKVGWDILPYQVLDES